LTRASKAGDVNLQSTGATSKTAAFLSNPENRFEQELQRKKMIVEAIQRKRLSTNPNVNPRETVRLRELQVEQMRENTRRFSLLNAHRDSMLTHAENNMDLLGLNNQTNILNAENLFSSAKSQENSIFKKKRLNVLQTQEANNNIKW